MKRTLVILAAITVSACGSAAARSASVPTTPEVPVLAPAVAETAAVATSQNEVAGTGATGVHGDGPANPAVVEEGSSSVWASDVPQTTIPSPAPAATTTTSSTIPVIALDLDISELDELLDELNSLLGGLEPVMNQSEGEITP